MMNHLRHLAILTHVVEAGSLSGAAKRLEVSPSVVSDSIKMLEAYFGEPLLQRRRSGAQPTPRGLAVYRHAADVVASANAALSIARTGEIAGPVRISMPEELAASWFVPAFHRIAADMHAVHLTILCEDQVLDANRHARDLFVRVGRSEHRGMTVLHAAPLTPVFVASASLLGSVDPTDPLAVAALPFICAPRAQEMFEIRLTAPDGTRAPVRFRRTLHVSAIQARLDLARQGLGVTGCLRPTVAAEMADGRLVEVLPGAASGSLSAAICTTHARPSATVLAVAEALSECLSSDGCMV